MFTILHADIEPLDKELYEKLVKRPETVFVHLGNQDDIIKYLEKNRVTLLFVGENLKNSTGIELINSINSSSNFKIPVIYIVNSDDDHYIENYSSIGVRDCIPRSEISYGKIEKHIAVIAEHKNMYKSMTDLSVAVIDDSPLALKVVVNILKEEGITNVKTFTDPVVLLKEYDGFQLFVVDIVMPGITGDKLVAMIRKMSPDSIIIAMSSIDNVKTISHVLNSGADDYVVKPLNNFELSARIKTNYRSYMLLKELEKKNQELDRISKTDSLTGAYNHGYIVESIKNKIEESRKTGEPFSMLMIDLDKFKLINDDFGHAVGDNVLTSFSKMVDEKCRPADMFGRYGGEEFLLLMPKTTIFAASTISNGLNSVLYEMEIYGVDRPVSFSGGLVEWDGSEDYKDLMKRVDDLLYSSKEGGRNRISE